MDILSVTVGGISAGCFMSTQMHFTYSTLIQGNACIAGGPFYCAQANEEIALTQCMSANYSELINIDYLESVIRKSDDMGYIDPTSHLDYSKVWLYSALNDSIVAQEVVKKNEELYTRFGADIYSIYNHIGEHAIVTDYYGNDCNYLGEPFINNCNFDAAASQMQFLYNEYPNKINGTLKEVNQASYMPVYWSPIWGLAETAYMFVPDNCLTNSCHLHVSFHGCKQSLDFIGLDYVNNSGYNRFENIIILYPQAISNDLNPYACFDWWGYTGLDYASNFGIQMVTVSNMIRNIIEQNPDTYVNK